MWLRKLIWITLSMLTTALGWEAGFFDWLHREMLTLANQPGVRDSYNEPGFGRVDAITTILSFMVLTPFALFVATLVFVFLLMVTVLMLEPVLRASRLPDWVAVPVVLLASAGGAWVASGFWMPSAFYGLGLFARAWLVYFAPIGR